MYIFRARKVKNIIFTLHDYFLHIVLKMETELPKKLVKPIAETRNAYDVSMHIYSIHSWIRNLKKIYNVKKNNFKRTKIKIRN